jgi:ABC-type dipeptide/oligopeptide/nickel transport system ATPase subunit
VFVSQRLIVMQGGRIVEELAASALGAHEVATDYTRALLAASEGYKWDEASSGAAFSRGAGPRGA